MLTYFPLRKKRNYYHSLITMEEATAAALQNPKAVAQAIEAEIGRGPEDPLSSEMVSILKKETDNSHHGVPPKTVSLPGDKPALPAPLSQAPAAKAAESAAGRSPVVGQGSSVKGKEKVDLVPDPSGHAECSSGLQSSEEALYAEIEAEKTPVVLPDVQPSMEEPGVPHDPQDMPSSGQIDTEARQVDMLRLFVDENAKAAVVRFAALEERVEALWAMCVGLERKVARIDQTRGIHTDIANTVSVKRAHLKRLSGEVEVPGGPSQTQALPRPEPDAGRLSKLIREFLRANPYPKVKAARQIRLKTLAASLDVALPPGASELPLSGWTEAGLLALFSSH